MHTLRRPLSLIAALVLPVLVATAAAQDANITQPIADLERLFAAEPLVITASESSRPNAKGNITLKAEISFGGSPPLRVKLRKAEPGADSFNNVPRYDLAAYELQKLFVDPAEYLVPPTALRMVPLADFAKHWPDVKRTFPTADQVLALVQYWLSDIRVIPDVYDPERFARDELYARHIGQLNILTYLVRHGDANLGNFLIGKAEVGPRVFSIDHGVAFASEESDRGEIWREMRVDRLPADTVERLRQITPEVLSDRLAVLAQWRLDGRNYVPVARGENLSKGRGVRRPGDQLQMGLNSSEIREVHRRLTRLLQRVDRGEIKAVPELAEAATAP
jgi:hypothetical protein